MLQGCTANTSVSSSPQPCACLLATLDELYHLVPSKLRLLGIYQFTSLGQGQDLSRCCSKSSEQQSKVVDDAEVESQGCLDRSLKASSS